MSPTPASDREQPPPTDDSAARPAAGSASTGSDSTAQPQTPARRHGRGGWRSLVISMGVLLAIVALWIALLPRPSATPRPAVDVAASAAYVSASSGTTLYVPSLPAQWRATSVRATDTASVPGWHAGYTQTDDDRAYVAVEETKATGGPSDEVWIAAVMKTAPQRETRTIGGRSWRLFSDGGDPERRSLVARLGSTLVVVTGLADLDVLAGAAESLRPVPPGPGATGSGVSGSASPSTPVSGATAPPRS
ncbi:MAG: DUF4245 domain-containing protein [Micrococcales bacterium]|nr:DUF4245 domain-containing protein [Micrococcales bacterium]